MNAYWCKFATESDYSDFRFLLDRHKSNWKSYRCLVHTDVHPAETIQQVYPGATLTSFELVEMTWRPPEEIQILFHKKSVYIAAPAIEQKSARFLREQIKSLVIVTSRWLDVAEVGYDGNEDRLRVNCLMDVADVLAADTFVCLNLPGSGGGMHTELGIAIQAEKEIHLIGNPTQVFHYLPQVVVFENMERWISHLRS